MAIRERLQDLKDRAGAGRGGRGAGRKPAGAPGFSFGTALEDLIALAGTLRGQAKTRAQGELERLAGALDLVTRREFEAVRAIAIAARTQAEELAARLDGKPVLKRSAAKPNAKPKPKVKPATKAAAKPRRR